jgi:hypothetical protein
MKKWKPSQSDKKWMEDLVSSIKDGGNWVVPANGSIWCVHRNDNLVNVLSRGADDELTERIIIAFKAIGYQVKDCPKELQES